MLTEIRLRDAWALAALALLPAIVLAILGLRALRGEEAAVRREAAVEVEAAARAAVDDLDLALGALALPSTQATDASLVTTLREAGRPIGGEPFVVELAPLRLRAPATADADPAHEDGLASPACTAALAVHDRASALSACEHARGASRRFLWPAIALAPDARPPVPAARIEAWIDAHQARLGGTERGAIRDDAARAGLASVVARLDAGAGVSTELGATLLDPAFERALRDLTAAPATLRVEGGLARARRLPDGRVVGVFLGRAPLAGWIAARGPARVRLSLGAPPVADREEPVAWAKLVDGLGVRAELRDPRALAIEASRSRRLLGGLAIAGASLALLGAALTVARLRRERRSAALRTDFVSTVSHELRTPIASIRMLSELLEQRRVEASEQPELFAAIAGESRRMGETVERLLGFGRLAAGRSVARRSRLDVVALTRAAIDEHRARFPDASIALDAPTALEAEADADQLRLSIDNLLANARKYAPESACEVRVRGVGAGVELRVIDHGPGVPARDRKRIFRPFERGDARLSAATEGSGIGLSLVEHVARAHDGRVRVEETPGGGATFVVEIGRSA